jgi:hypothetical protein
MSVPVRPQKVKTGLPAQRVTTIEELAELIVDGRYRIKLDCGHYCTLGHNLSNTLIIWSLGGGRISTFCHNCYL